MDKNEKVPLKDKNNNVLSSDDSNQTKVLEKAPDPRGRNGRQIDSDLNNY